MKQYHKIQSIFKRDIKTHKFIIGEFSLPEFEYLQHNIWIWDEKIDGTNIKIVFENDNLIFGGKTDNAQIPSSLVNKLKSMFSNEQMKQVFMSGNVILYGEGFGKGIQSGGKYISNDVSFVLFDVFVDNSWWLRRFDVEDVANKLDIAVAPVVGKGTLHEAVEYTKKGFNSQWGDFIAEGLVLRPSVPLFSRNGERIITKVKYKDF
jgi:hypothetical protein